MMKNNQLNQDFNRLSLIKFALPTILVLMFNGFYTIVDTIFIARFVDTYALSAINIVTPIINLIVGIASMVATGGNAIIARKLGNHQDKEARNDFVMFLVVICIVGISISITGLFFLKPIIYFLGASELLYHYCFNYLSIILVFTTVNMLQVFFANLLITAGKPSLGLFLGVGGGLCNIILDYLFIVVFKMGISGAALGTAIGYLVTVIGSFIFFKDNKGNALYLTKFKLDIKTILEACFNGVSEMVSQLSMAITTLFLNIKMMQLLGEAGVASITIIIYLQFLLTTLFFGFSTGVSPVISYTYGAKNHQRLQKLFRICIEFIVVSTVLMMFILILFHPILISLFSPIGTYIYEISVGGFKIFMISFVFIGFNVFSSALFTSLSNGKLSAIISFLRTFGFIMVGLIVLPNIFKVNGIWMSIPIAECCGFFVSGYIICKYRKEYHLF